MVRLSIRHENIRADGRRIFAPANYRNARFWNHYEDDGFKRLVNDAERLRQALTAQFGPSILCFVEPGAGFENHPCYTIEGASPRFSDFRDINLYQASLSDYDLRLNFYGPSVTGSGEFEVQLAFATAEDTPMYKSVMELFGREAKEFDAAAQDALLERERGGVLRGIE